MTEKVLACYDFTLKKDGIEVEKVIEFCNKLAKKWAFQVEKSDSGYVHYQGKMSLKTKKRMSTLKNSIGIDCIHLSPTLEINLKKWDYVTKEETRIEGPWQSENIENLIPWDVQLMVELKPWQTSVIEISKIRELRRINVIFDPVGGIGKTSLTRYMMVYKLGQIIPFCNDFKDILRIVCDAPSASCYIIDMPRAINKEKLHQLYSAIEVIKGGYAYDDRYTFKQKIFHPPVVFVFTNVIPDRGLLTNDRWIFWGIRDDNLVNVEF